MDTRASTTHDEVTAVVSEAARTATASSTPATRQPGSAMGRYLIIAEEARGGMGVVWRAYDPKLQREIALKSLRIDAMTDEARARMIREARAMAKLNHPNVVAVYDVELEDDGVVLAMEFVEGQTLRTWLRTSPPWREVLHVFGQAGRGLSAAHRVGLLHRDFKPANVLVGSDGRARVTDFGLARWDEGPVSSTASEAGPAYRCRTSDVEPATGELTEAGIVMGTPPYMAPEQHDGLELGPAADQYAFCVALWEGLTGARPFHGNSKELAAVKHRGPPPWPRGTTLPRFVMHAIERGLLPRPEQRWPSMEALLERLARNPSTRRKNVVLGGTMVGLLGAVLWAWSTPQATERCTGAEAQLRGAWDAQRRTAAEQALRATEVAYAEQVWLRIAPVLDTYAADWIAMHTETCQATTVRGEQSAAIMDLRMRCLAGAKQQLTAVGILLVEADGAVVEKAHDLVSGLPPLDRCAEVEALQADVVPPNPTEEGAVEQLRGQLARAKTLRDVGKFLEGAAVMQEVTAKAEAVHYGPLQAEVALERGLAHRNAGAFDEAEAALKEALRLGLQWKQWNVAQLAAVQLVFIVGDVLTRPEEGLAYAETAWGLLALNGSEGGRAEADLRNSVANVLRTAGRYAEAEAEHRKALALRESVLGPEHPLVGSSRNNLAAVLYSLGKFEDAEAEYRQSVAVREKALGPQHPDVATSRSNLGATLQRLGRFAEAQKELRETIALREKILGPEHPHTATSRINLGNALWAAGRDAEAETVYRVALAQLEHSMGPEYAEVLTIRSNLASMLRSKGDLDTAEAEYREILALREKALGDAHPVVASARYYLALVLIDRKAKGEAVALLEQAWATSEGSSPATRASIAFELARLLWDTGGDRARARTLAKTAESLHAEANSEAASIGEVQTWRRRH